MSPDEFRQMVARLPIRIRMNDGREFFIRKGESVMVGDSTAGFLVSRNGIKHNTVITLKNIASVTRQIAPPFDRSANSGN